MTATVATGIRVRRRHASRLRTSWAATLACVLGALHCAAPAWASSLQVAPILLELEPRQQAEALWLRNSGTAPIRAQVRVQAWTQEGGVDALSPTRDVVASPAMLEIAPGARQLVRIIRLQPAPFPQERSFRLLVDELPVSADGRAPVGLRVLLRYSIPMFIAPVGPGKTGDDRHAPAMRPLSNDLHLSLAADAGGSRLSARNDGSRRIKISALSLVGGDGSQHAINPGLVGYVLAGRSVGWHLPLPYPLKPGQSLKARIDDAPEAQTLPVDGAGR